MRITAAITAAVVLFLLVASTVAAKGPVNKATGGVEWTARGGDLPGLVTEFNAHDVDTEGSDGDKGTLTTTRPADEDFAGGTITIDISCVNVDGDEAWMAGTAVEATGGYEANLGDFYLYWVEDASTPGEPADKIGGRSYNTLGQACAVAEAGGWTGNGDVDAGNLKVHTY